MPKLLIAAICLVACVGASSTAYANHRDWHGPNHPYYVPPMPPPPPPPPPGPVYYGPHYHEGYNFPPPPPPSYPQPFHHRREHERW